MVVCALSSNLKRAEAPGNILLEAGEAGLNKPSVVLVSQIFTVDKSRLDEYIGSLPRRRVRRILEGIQLVLEPRELDNQTGVG